MLATGALWGALTLEQLGARAAPLPFDVSDKTREPDAGIDWNYWLAVNPDLVGWLRVEGTALYLPVVQAHVEEQVFYLSHDVSREANLYGCPYLDAACAVKGLASPNAVVSGHSTSDGAMFSPLLSFADEGFAAAHQNVVIDTPDGPWTYRVCAVRVEDARFAEKRTTFEDREDFEAWYHSFCEGACVVLEEQPPQRVLSLVACSYFEHPEDERIVVLCAAEDAPSCALSTWENDDTQPDTAAAA